MSTVPKVLRIIEKNACAGNVAQNVQVPSGVNWKLLAIAVKMVTDATVANRYLTIAIRDPDDDPLFTPRIAPVQVASKTYTYTYGPGLTDMTALIDTTNLHGVIPNGLKLPAGSDFNFVITAGVAGDAFGYRIVVEEEGFNV